MTEEELYDEIFKRERIIDGLCHKLLIAHKALKKIEKICAETSRELDRPKHEPPKPTTSDH